MGLKQMNKILGRLPPPGYCTDSRLEHIPSRAVNKSYLSDMEFWPGEQT